MDKELKVYKMFRQKFDHEQSMTIMRYLHDKNSHYRQKQVESKIQHLATKADIQKIISEIKIWMCALWVATVVVGVIITTFL